MKKNSIEIGGLYTAKVSGKVVEVRIETAATNGGWVGVNTANGKRIRIKSAQRLRRAVGGNSAVADTGADQQPDKGGKKNAKSPKAKKPPAEKKPKRVSALDAAATVLQKAGKPMHCNEMIQVMAEQGLWSSPNGKTPAATLYSAILREVANKGGESRFKKADRGQFEFVG
jgi:hypothetical protein